MAISESIDTNQYITEPPYRDALGALKRNYVVILLTTLLFIALAVVIGLLIPKQFQSSAIFFVEGRTQNSPVSYSPEDVDVALTTPQANYDIVTQIQRLTSINTTAAAWEQAGIARPAQLTEQALEQLPRSKAEQKGQSNAIEVVVTGPNEKDVYNFLSVLPTVFEQELLTQQKEAVRRAITFINTEIQKEESAVIEIRKKISETRAATGIVDPTLNATVMTGRLADLEVQLAQAKGAYDGAVAARAKAEAEFRMMPDKISRPFTESNNSIVTSEKQRLVALQQQRQTLLQRYTEKHPDVIAINQQIADQQQVVNSTPTEITTNREEINPVKENLRLTVLDAKAKEESAKAVFQALTTQVASRKTAQPAMVKSSDDQKALEDLLRDKQKQLDNLREKGLQISLRDNRIRQPLRVMTPARPAKQIRPDWPVYLALATLFGIAAGCVLAIAKDSMNDRITSQAMAESLGNSSVLATIPERKRSGNPAIEAHHKAVSFEGYRILRTNVLLKMGNRRPKQFVVAAITPGEGASVVAANLATASAAAGLRTVFVDANLRRPSGASLFGIPGNSVGLGDALASSDPITHFLSDTGTEGLKVLAAGNVPALVGEALASPRMKQIVDELGLMADVVVYDSPAFMGVADSVALASIVGTVATVVVPGKTPRSEFKEFCDMLRIGNIELLGLVMNRTSPSSISEYDVI